MTKHPEWKGFVDDLGGPTANMYGLDTAGVAPAHRRLIALMRAVRKVPGVKKVFVRSGIRYDLALEMPRLRPGTRPPPCFRPAQDRARTRLGQGLAADGEERRPAATRRVPQTFRGRRREDGRPAPAPQILLHGRPSGDDREGSPRAGRFPRELERSGEKPVEGVQIFTPTPMTRSTCMYHTGRIPSPARRSTFPGPTPRRRPRSGCSSAARTTERARRPEKTTKRDQVFALGRALAYAKTRSPFVKT